MTQHYNNIIMSISHIKYPKILSQHKLLKEMVFTGLDKATFYSTVKLHGMNAAIVVYPDNKSYHVQSRNMIISKNSNTLKGIHEYIFSNKQHFFDLKNKLCSDNEHLVFFGEWCGEGIQSKVALNKLSKRFVLFDVMTSDKKWLTKETMLKIEEDSSIDFYNIYKYESKSITVSVDENVDETQEILKTITDSYANECPYSMHHGVSGKGEGLVWTYEYNIYNDKCDRMKFKTKGSSYSCVMGEGYLLTCEEFKCIKKAVEFCITENRVKQGISELNLELNNKRVAPKLIEWVINDALSEEHDVIPNIDGFKKRAGTEVMRHYSIITNREL